MIDLPFSLSLILPLCLSQAQVVDPSTINNKILAGYQGWFNAVGDGSGEDWSHWSQSSDIGPGLYNVSLWPDTSEFDTDEVFPCPNVVLLDGSMGQLFSSYMRKTTERHFKWMKETGIDGIMLQRFIAPYGGISFQVRNQITLNVAGAANTHGRVFMIEYDISGEDSSTLYNHLTQDWKYLIDNYDIMHHPRYLHQNGKPVVSIWGLGITDRPSTPTNTTQLINFFRNDPVYGGCYIIGGVAPGWRDLSDGFPDPAWSSIYRSLDMIAPWTVGAYVYAANEGGINNYKLNYTVPDLAECNSLGIGYQQVIWPGFNWDNARHLPPGTSNYPRQGGQFFWDQAYAYQAAGVNMIKVAMFDECDEGTAILKVSQNHPNTDYWVDYGTLPHDWYLRLAGSVGRMLRKEIPLVSSSGNSTLPTPLPLDPVCNGDEVSYNLGEDVADRMTRISVGDGNTTAVTKCNVSCRKNVSTTTDQYMYFGVADSFAFQGNHPEQCVTIDYYDGNCTGTSTTTCTCSSCSCTSSYSLHLQYDSIAGGVTKDGGSVTLGNTNTWKRKIFHVTDAYFGNRENNGADFRIAFVRPSSGNFYIDRVLVTSTVPKPPVIQLSPTSTFNRTIALGTQTSSDTLTIINMGVAALNYTANASAAWLSVTPMSGKSTGETDTLSIVYDTAALTRGHHTANVNVVDVTATNSPQSVVVDINVIAFADFDSDNDVDMEDFGKFQTCLSGGAVPYEPGCLAGDSNGDGDVDAQDFTAFLACMNGPNHPTGCP